MYAQERRGCLRRRVVGTRWPGVMTWADISCWGKSFGFKVTMKSARPASAHPQNGSSPGSGEMFGRVGECTNSASSRSKLTIFPMRGRRTPNLANTRLYSTMISSVTSQTNVSPSIQSLSSFALGLRVGISKDFSSAIPATRTDVSTTPLGRFLRWTGNDGDLRMFLPPHSAFANGF